MYAQLEARASTAEGGYSDAGQDVTELAKQLEAAGARLEELVEENEDLQIKCKELELRETTLQEVPRSSRYWMPELPGLFALLATNVWTYSPHGSTICLAMRVTGYGPRGAAHC